eukprot:UN08932
MCLIFYKTKMLRNEYIFACYGKGENTHD